MRDTFAQHGLVGWSDSQTYAYLATASYHGWAWEFLRRNPRYRFDVTRCGAKPTIRCCGIEVIKLSASDGAEAARPWGLLYLVQPEIDCRHASIFWRPDLCASVLPVAVGKDAMLPGARAVDPARLSCRTTLVMDRGRQHLLFADEAGRFLQLSVCGDQIAGPIYLMTDAIPQRNCAETRLKSIRRLTDLVERGGLYPRLYPVEIQARRLGIVLQALDGYLAKASQREIATVLFGKERVETDWSHPGAHLRDQVRRAIRRGRDLMNGGYLKLLR